MPQLHVRSIVVAGEEDSGRVRVLRLDDIGHSYELKAYTQESNCRIDCLYPMAESASDKSNLR